jgi:hypothetical protein
VQAKKDRGKVSLIEGLTSEKRGQFFGNDLYTQATPSSAPPMGSLTAQLRMVLWGSCSKHPRIHQRMPWCARCASGRRRPRCPSVRYHGLAC